MGGLDSFVGELAEILPQRQRFLGSQRLEVRHSHVCDHAHLLFLSLSFCLVEFLVENLSIQAQLSTEHDFLLDEKALLTPVKRSAPDLLALVADGWVWIESRLLLSAFGGLDIGGGLRKRRVVL